MWSTAGVVLSFCKKKGIHMLNLKQVPPVNKVHLHRNERPAHQSPLTYFELYKVIPCKCWIFIE